MAMRETTMKQTASTALIHAGLFLGWLFGLKMEAIFSFETVDFNQTV
jgi:hypothetical protein